MASIQSKVFRVALRIMRVLRMPATAQNLPIKRAAYARLERYLRVADTITIEPVVTPEFRGEWLRVPESRNDAVVLYLHGGGFVFDSTRLHRDMIARIAAAGQVSALSVDYSLAPEHPFPAALNETLAAYRWLLGQGFAPERIVIAGDSAGGSLALSAQHAIIAEDLPRPAGAVAISPAADATVKQAGVTPHVKRDYFMNEQNIEFYIGSYFQDTPRDHPIASPIHGSFEGWPPLLLHVSKNEVMHSDAVRMVHKARQQGVNVDLYEVDNLWHVWHLSASFVPEAQGAINHIGTFIKRLVV